jgi:hypothetical protein
MKGVVVLEDYDPLQGVLTTRHVEGRLLERSTWRELSSPQRLEIALSLVDIVDSIHARGVVHGDLKPSNIIVSEDGQTVTLIDFDHALVDGEGVHGGTRHHAAPEVFYLPFPELLDYRSDYYSLALLLRGLLFDRPYKVDPVTRWQSLFDDVTPPNPDEPLSKSIERLMSPWREDRPASLDRLRGQIARASGRPTAERHRAPTTKNRIINFENRLNEISDSIPDDLRALVSADLLTLAPLIHPRAPSFELRLSPDKLRYLMRHLCQRQMQLSDAPFAAAHLGLTTGLLRTTLAWSKTSEPGVEGPLIEAIAANAFGAFEEAETRLTGLLPDSASSPLAGVVHAVLAQSLSSQGAGEQVKPHLMSALELRPQSPSQPMRSSEPARFRFWHAVTMTNLSAMDIAGLATILEALPGAELGEVSLITLEICDEYLAGLSEHDARGRARRPGFPTFITPPAKEGRIYLCHLIIDLALLHWPETRAGMVPILETLERASSALMKYSPDDAFGPLVSALVLARQGQFAKARVISEKVFATFPQLGSLARKLAPEGAEGDADWYALIAGWALDLEPVKRHVSISFGDSRRNALVMALDALFTPELRHSLRVVRDQEQAG